jgi:hypothetical protein
MSVCCFHSTELPCEKKATFFSRSCGSHFPRALEEDGPTMRQYGVTGKSFEQQCYQVERAIKTFKILHGIRLYADRAAAHLREIIAYDLPFSLQATVRKLSLAFLNLPRKTLAPSNEWATEAIAKLCHDLYPSRQDSLAGRSAIIVTEGLERFAAALLPCVRAVLRFPSTQGHARATWILLRTYLQEVAKVASSILAEHENAAMAATVFLLRRNARDHAADLGGELLWEDEELMDLEEDAEDAEDAVAEAVAEAVAVPEELAAFAADHQNVHTAPARSGAERVLKALLPPVEPRLQELCDSIGLAYPAPKRGAAFLEYVENDSPEAMELPILRINHQGQQYAVNPVVSYGGLVRIAIDYCVNESPDRQYGILQGILAHIAGAYRSTSSLRVEDLGDFLSCWMSHLLPPHLIENPFAYTAGNWILHWNDSLVQMIHAAWAEALLSAKLDDAWTEVLEDAAWTEFRHDVDTVSNFGVTYAELLSCVWSYAETQSAEIQKEIAVRIAEEVLDGLGMCEQGKITRLTNVLRGFHPALDDISVLSVGEQLQNRMAVISGMPAEERRAAADAVFAELGVPAEEQEAWREAVLEA